MSDISEPHCKLCCQPEYACQCYPDPEWVRGEAPRWPGNADWKKYLDYLASPEWKAKRKQVIERCRNVCECCWCDTVEDIHHITYKSVFHENLGDLVGLCRQCHKNVHSRSLE
jgi:5-methylcytosine-specific restriction endonuclease McrA